MTLVLILWIMFRSDSIGIFGLGIEIIISEPGIPEIGKSI